MTRRDIACRGGAAAARRALGSPYTPRTVERADDILELARTLPRERFIRAVSCYMLVIADNGPDSKPFAYETVAATPAAYRKLPPPGPATEVFPVTKAKDNPFPDQISVGRTRNCDVVLRSPSVSKLHAHFSRDPDGGLHLVDNGSQNGTRVNGKLLYEREPFRVASGDVIQFGRLTTTLLDAAGLFDMLRGQISVRSGTPR